MQLNEFIGTDRPSSEIRAGHEIIEEMLQHQGVLDTIAFLQIYRTTVNSLPAIAAERALTTDWEEHPMFGINYVGSIDKRAKEYQRVYEIAERIFAVLIERMK